MSQTALASAYFRTPSASHAPAQYPGVFPDVPQSHFCNPGFMPSQPVPPAYMPHLGNNAAPLAQTFDLKLQSRGIPFLGLDNFHVWKRRIVDALEFKGVQRFLTCVPSEFKLAFDQQVYYFMRTLISDRLIAILGNHSCSAHLWSAISTLNVANSQSTLQQLKRDFYQSKLANRLLQNTLTR